MKKIFSYIFILVAISGFILPSITHAQVCTDDYNQPVTYDEARCKNTKGYTWTPAGQTAPNAKDYGNAGTNNSDNSSWWMTSIIQPFIAWMATLALSLTSLLTGLGGLILNGAILHTIVNVSENYKNIPAINETWGTIRDLSNMVFIFVLLYAAIQKILGIGEDVQRLIVRVVVVAILINFSLFFTQVVIDISNLLALTFYDAMVPNAATQGLTSTGLSNAFMQHLRVQGLFQTEWADNLKPMAIITTGVMGSIMLLIASFVFFAVGLLFIIRYVVLIIVLILSPIAFISFVLPQLASYRKQWSDALINQAFFAPVYFMLTWVTLRVLDGVTKGFGPATGTLADISTTGIANTSGAVNASTIGFFPTFINFATVIAFLIISIVIAKEMSGKTAGGVGKLTSWASGFAGKATFGLAGQTGRLAAGAFVMSPDSEKYKRLEAQSAKGGVGGAMARLRLATADKTRTSSFDLRGSRVGGILGGLDAGKAQEGGFEADKKVVREFLEKPGTEAYKKRQERARKAGAELGIRDNLADAKEYDRLIALETAATAGGPALSAPDAAKLANYRDPTHASYKKINDFETAINKATTKEIEVIVESNRSLLKSQEFANRISVQQLDAINKSDKFTEQEKDTLKDQRFAAINTALAPGGAGATSVRQNIRRLSDTELEMINPAYLADTDFVAQMQPSQIDTVNKSTKFTTSQKGSLRNTRRSPLITALRAGNAAHAAGNAAAFTAAVSDAERAVKGLGHKEIASIEMSDLMTPTMVETFTPELLKRMAQEMNPADIPTLRAYIIATLPTTHKAHAWLLTPAGIDKFS